MGKLRGKGARRSIRVHPRFGSLFKPCHPDGRFWPKNLPKLFPESASMYRRTYVAVDVI
jgi:hypothetical protein